MNPREAAWLAHQRRRWMLPDPSRWLQPDQSKWMRREPVWRIPPQGPAQPQERKYQAPVLHAENLARLGRSLAILRRELARVQAELLARKAGFDPNQPRVPAGNSDGGQWTDGGGLSGGRGGNDGLRWPAVGRSWIEREGNRDRVHLAQAATGTVTDIDGTPYYKPGGHHEMPKGVYKQWNLQPETQKVFRQSSTGTLNAKIGDKPDGPRVGNIWDGKNGLHFAYNEAVRELGERFIQAHKLRPDAADMTPDQARALLKEIRLSEDPRIRDFNLNMKRMYRLRRLRGGDD